MLDFGKAKKNAEIPMILPVLFGKTAVAEDGEAAEMHYYLDTDKIGQEILYDGLYAVTTDLLDDDVTLSFFFHWSYTVILKKGWSTPLPVRRFWIN